MAAISRIFVRNLPPSLTEPEFKSHFATSAPITDAKIIPHRRIGYVGYKTPEEAAKAVKYFNKSFIRLSRIGVELAKGVGEVNGTKREKKGDSGRRKSDDDERSVKRVKVEETKLLENPKLKEFLNVMQPSKKSKTWADGDVDMGVTQVIPEPEMVIAGEKESDDEYEAMPKKQKRTVENSEEKSEPKVDLSTNGENIGSEIEGFTGNESTVQEEDEKRHSQGEPHAPKSDADWVRSRTSRLLGLLDDDEINAQTEARDTLPLEKGASIGGSRTVPEESATTSQADGPADRQDLTPTLDPPKPDVQPPVEDTGRLFIRNLSYESTQNDLHEYFSVFGRLEEVHIPQDSRTGASKGFAYVQFASVEDASIALHELDGKPFQGRLLHILPAAAKRESTLDDFAISKLPHKKQQEIRRKKEASSTTFKWNSLYMNPDAVLSSVADRLQISKSELLDPTSASAAVRQAHAETNIIQETKAYFSKNGVNLDAFRKGDFSDTAILVKNFPYGTSAEEIRQLFEAHGSLRKLLMPPSGTIAIVELEQPGQARAAFGSLAYRKFKDSVLFLEKAPRAIFDGAAQAVEVAKRSKPDNKLSTSDLLDELDAESDVKTSATLFVRNLNFSTSSAQLHDLFKPLSGFKSARVKTKTDSKRPGQVLSMGFGFVEFRSKQDAQSARAAMDGYNLDGHSLVIKESHKALDAAEERRKEDRAKKLAGRRTKIIIKNLPFEATKKDVQQLFGPYGKLCSVRVPKKFDSSTRGFAFADFVTAREAENAMEALAGSHLLGRRLNLDFAADDSVDPEEEIEKMSRKVGKQANKVALQRLTAGGRKKFSVNNEADEEGDVT